MFTRYLYTCDCFSLLADDEELDVEDEFFAVEDVLKDAERNYL